MSGKRRCKKYYIRCRNYLSHRATSWPLLVIYQESTSDSEVQKFTRVKRAVKRESRKVGKLAVGKFAADSDVLNLPPKKILYRSRQLGHPPGSMFFFLNRVESLDFDV